MTEEQRARALPLWGEGEIPPERDRAAPDDVRGFTDVVRVFLRTWPYLMPMVMGYWREYRVPGVSRADAGATAWSYRYVPILVTALVIAGPSTGWLPFGESWQTELTSAGTFALALLSWAVVLLSGRVFVASVVALLVVALVINLFASLVVAGWLDNVFVGAVSLACLAIWLLQCRFVDGALYVRVRLGCHLAYYYALVWLLLLIGIVAGLFTFDLLNQSILQAKPLTPFLANLVGAPELASGAIEALDPVQRGDLQWVYVAIMVAIGLLTFPLRVAMPYYNVWIMQRINQALRVALLSRWHQLSLRYHSGHRVGDAVYRIYQDSAQVTAIIGLLIEIATQATQYLVVVLFVAALAPVLGLMGATIAVFAIAWAFWFSPRVRVRSLVARETNSDLTSRVQEVMGAVGLIKANGMEPTEQQRFENDSVVAFNAAFRVRSLVAVVGIVMFTLASGVLLGGEFLMALWANEGREAFAAVLIGLIGLSFVNWNLGAFQWARGELFKGSGQVRGIVSQWTLAQDMAMGLDRVFEILDIEPEVKNAPDALPMPPFRRELRLEHVHFAYEVGQPTLIDVNLAVRPGTINAVVGPTGSGKSTLVSLLARLFDPDEGRITIDGTDLRKLDVESLRSNISIALQESVLFGMTVRDNIRYVVPDAPNEAVRHAAYIACADEYIDELPDGMDTLLGDRGGRLSAGQRQRLSIARALVKDASILILDEPTAALDAETEHRVLGRLSSWCRERPGNDREEQGRVIFLITHRISTIRQADQILFVDGGTIVESGTDAELMSLPKGRYRQFVESEAILAGGGVDS